MTDTLYAFIKHSSSFGDQSDFQCWLYNLLAVTLGKLLKNHLCSDFSFVKR